MKSRVVRIIIVGVVVCALVGGGIWLWQTRSSAQSATTTTDGYTQIVSVQQGDLNASLSVVGELASAQSQDMTFDRMSGTSALLTLAVEAGNTVKAGDVLATIDPSPYQQALDQAQTAFQESLQALEDLQTPPTELEIAQADLAIAKAKLDIEQAEADLADLQAAPDLSDLQVAVQNARDDLELAKLQQNMVEHDSLVSSERNLSYAVDYHDRLIQQLQDLVASGKANVEQTERLETEKESLAETQAELAQVRAKLQLARESAGAQVTAAEAQLADAQEALADAQAGGSDVDLAQARLKIQQAKVSLQSAEEARADLDEGPDAVDLAAAQADVDKKQWAVNEAEADLASATMVAPFDGTILEVNAEPGDRITASSPILTIANLDDLRVNTSIDETTIRQVQAGQPATITFDAFPGQTFTGQVLSVPLQGSLQGGVMVYEVPVSLEGAEDLPLLVGMTANGAIRTGEAKDALLVPTMALQTVNGMVQVLVPTSSDAAGSTVAVPVEVGLSNGTYTQITKGLNAGDQVVVQYSASDSNNAFRNFGGGGTLRFLTGMR